MVIPHLGTQLGLNLVRAHAETRVLAHANPQPAEVKHPAAVFPFREQRSSQLACYTFEFRTDD